MADHQELIHAAAAPAAMYRGATTSSTTQASHVGDWWSTAVAPPVSSCSPEMPGFGSWSAAAAAGHVDVVDSNRSRWSNTASSESPGSNSLATGSSITFQEPTGVADPATIAVPQTAAAGFATGWNQSFLDGSGFHGYMSSRSDQNHIDTPSLMSPSLSNNMMPQDHHDQSQNYQFLSNLGFELLSSPTTPYGGFRSSLLRSLTEPAAAKPNSPGFQQYRHTMDQQAPAASIRLPLQFTNDTPFWNPSTGFATPADGEGLGAAGPPPVQTRPASLATKSTLEEIGDSSSVVITKKANANPNPLKKARTGTPSPLPIFKVRKEKLGNRITALQQLVSPFGKTDTASVLHETIEYIRFLHEQVGALSAPYLKNQQQAPQLKLVQSSIDKSKDGGGEVAATRGLTGRGLCLVPISSTFAVASETPVDFWTPFGAAFR